MKLRRFTSLAALAALVSIGAVSEGRAGGGTPITSCGQVVTTSAFVTKDLVCTGTSGIVVGASGITIDLKGHIMRGDRSFPHFGIDDSGAFDQVTIKNGTVSNFAYGVFADTGSDDVSVSKVLVSGNNGYGIFLSGASVKITSSTASGNHIDGIFVDGTSASISSSIVVGNGTHGIVVGGASATIKSSTASGNGIDGMFVGGISAKIESSTASGNGRNGIVVTGDAARIKANRAEANGFGAADLVGAGIFVTWPTIAPVGTNVARGNDDPAECAPASLC
jgi:hypothetical protein